MYSINFANFVANNVDFTIDTLKRYFTENVDFIVKENRIVTVLSDNREKLIEQFLKFVVNTDTFRDNELCLITTMLLDNYWDMKLIAEHYAVDFSLDDICKRNVQITIEQNDKSVLDDIDLYNFHSDVYFTGIHLKSGLIKLRKMDIVKYIVSAYKWINLKSHAEGDPNIITFAYDLFNLIENNKEVTDVFDGMCVTIKQI